MTRLISIFVITAATLFAQGRSSILGTITEESGAIIPAASVTVLNTGTQQKWAVKSSSSGLYEVPALEVGVYDVSVEMSGFRKTTVRAITLEVDQRERVDVKLQVGEVTQQISVNAEALSVNTDDATIGTVIDAAKIRELPLPGNRNLFRLALLAPGMSRGPASSVTTSGFGPGFGVAAMGQKVQNNAIYLDGAPLRTSIHGAVRMRPSVEAIEEFRVEAGWYSAEYGTQSGAQIVATIRPGTNDLHGTLFEFLRNDVLDAHNFFDAPGSKKPPLHRNTFGGVLSGPVWIPKLYNGKNKTFFTFNGSCIANTAALPGSAFIRRDQDEVGRSHREIFPAGRRIADPDHGSGCRRPLRRKSDSRQPHLTDFDKLAAFWPTPNIGTGEFDGSNNFYGVSRNRDSDDQYFVRIDHNFNDKNRLFGRYGIQTVQLPVFPINPNPFFVQRRPRRQQNATMNYTRVLGATWLNALKVSYNRDVFKANDDVSGTDFNILRDLGIPGQTNVPSDTGLPEHRLGRHCLRPWDHRHQHDLGRIAAALRSASPFTKASTR